MLDCIFSHISRCTTRTLGRFSPAPLPNPHSAEADDSLWEHLRQRLVQESHKAEKVNGEILPEWNNSNDTN